MVMSQRIYWISQKCFHCYGVVDFKRPHFKILTKSQPIAIIGRWASLKQTKSTFQRLPVQNNKQLGCHKLNLEPSPHIPYGENRRLEWDWGDLGISLYEGAAWILGWEGGGWEVITKVCSQFRGSLIWNCRNNWPQARIDCHEYLRGRGLELERWGREVWGNRQFDFTCLDYFICSLTFWLLDLFVCFARKTSEGSGLGL